ncbi:MAG: hypothetical protein AAFP10_02095 [Pseudomonadota bacterium]
MSIEKNTYLYTYAVTRDFGFAPNPFHGLCTLATCKPKIRKSAKVNDWVMGIGGSKLKSVKRKCIFIMKVSEVLSFQQYWEDKRFGLKKPQRNGTQVKMLGDNIYHRCRSGSWMQEDSHHSNEDGSPNLTNLNRDTGTTDHVLISDYFLYFGSTAKSIDLEAINYGKVRDYKKTDLSHTQKARELISHMFTEHRSEKNMVLADPCQFVYSHKRVDQGTNKIL